MVLCRIECAFYITCSPAVLFSKLAQVEKSNSKRLYYVGYINKYGSQEVTRGIRGLNSEPTVLSPCFKF
jgi:hypothetical protein